MTLLPLLAFALQAPIAAAGARSPAYAPDGRLVLELHGDLYLAPDGARPEHLVPLVNGPALDIEPAWTRDGKAVVFSSDRDGTFQLWRQAVGAGGPVGAPEELTRGEEPSREPAPTPDGGVVFVRGRWASAALWGRDAAGKETRLGDTSGAERAPAVSPDGKQLAFIAVKEGRRELHVKPLAGGKDRVLGEGLPAEHPAWSPDGRSIVFTTGGRRPGVWVTPAEGGYVNLLSREHARPVWSPDGARVLLAELPADEPAYNGDPDRVGDRDAQPLPGAVWRVWSIPAPALADAGRVELPVSPQVTAGSNGAAFDRAWQRVADLYLSAPEAAARRRAWERARDELRPRAVAAKSPQELARVIHELERRHPPYREESRGRAAISSANPYATDAGLEMLRRGGNVVDAAVAVSFALAVVEPDASGPGGYGQMLIRLRGMEKPALIEFMARAPEEASLSNASFLTNGQLADDGPTLVAVPGTVDGMWRAWQRFGGGKLKWKELLQPAIRLAEQGFVLGDAFPTTLRREREHYMKYESTRELFFPGGKPLVAGDTFRNPDLAWTLKRIADRGADAFYRGAVAEKLVTDLRGHGNPISLRDMARYFAAWREPVSQTYRGYTVYSSAPPASGGALLSAQLNLLEHARDLKSPTEDAATAHAMLEAWALTPSARGRIADPGLWPVDLSAFTRKDSADARWRCFDPQRAVNPAAVDSGTAACQKPGSALRATAPETRLAAGAGDDAPFGPECNGLAPDFATPGCDATGTTAFVVGDAAGDLVAVTQTLGTWGGNFYVTPGLGFIYNDKMGSYGSDPDRYGARLPDARHGSTIAPTLIFRGTGEKQTPLAALGAAGNAWIGSAVFQIATGIMDRGLGPQAAIEQPRFLPSTRPGPDGRSQVVIELESGYSPDVLHRLEAMGHHFQVVSFPGELRMGYASAVVLDGKQAVAGADPRRDGAAGAVKD